MKNKNGISLQALYTRNKERYTKQTATNNLNQPSLSTLQKDIKTPSSTESTTTTTKQYPSNAPTISSYASKYIAKRKDKNDYLNQTINNYIEEENIAQYNTVYNNTANSKGLLQKNAYNSKTTKCFVPLSKLSPNSIASVARIIPSITSKRNTKDNNGNCNGNEAYKTKDSFMYQPLSRAVYTNSRTILNQLVKNQEQHIKNNLNQTMYDTNNNDISFCNSTITSSSNVPPLSVTNNNKTNFHKRELSIISLESSPEIIIISHEDLLLIEDKLHDILSLIELGHVAHNECFEWWNYYFNSTIAGKYGDYFLNEDNKTTICSYANIELLCVMLCYAISLNKEFFNEYINEFKAIFSSLHFNLLLMIKMIITKQKGINDSSYAKLTLMMKKSLTFLKENEIDEFFIVSLIKHNINSVSEIYLKIIEKEYGSNMAQTSYSNFFTLSYQNRASMTVDEYDDFFRLNILKVNNPDGSILASSLTKLSEGLLAKQKPKVPFLPITSKFKYTLVLDLDETLVHLSESKDNTNNNSNGSNCALFLRPNLIPFLQKVKRKFELIVFTAGTQEYADNIINVIEKKERFFSHRLYREHTLVVGNDFIKDLNKLGRDLSRIVIVDNMPQNYRLQKANGIFIKAFLGDNQNDSSLTHLGDLLFKIANDNGDIRKGLLKYKDDIVTMVSLNKMAMAKE